MTREQSIKALCRKLNRQTDENDHTGVVITLARSIPNTEVQIEALTRLKADHMELGHLTGAMSQARRDISAQIDRLARAHFTPDEWKAIYASM